MAAAINNDIAGGNGALRLYLVDQLFTFFEKELSPSSRELLDTQRTLLFAGPASGARPDFIFAVYVADQGFCVSTIAADPGIVFKGVIAPLYRNEARRKPG